MQAEHVSLGVDDQGDEAVLADGKLLLVDASPRFCDAAFFDRAVFATEIDQGAVAAGGNALHLDQGAAGARSVHLHSKRPHVHSRAVELFQLALEHGFVEFLRSIHFLHVDLEPDGGIFPHRDSPVLTTAFSRPSCASPAASGPTSPPYTFPFASTATPSAALVPFISSGSGMRNRQKTELTPL